MSHVLQIIEALSTQGAYDHRITLPVKVEQTQMSVVFLTGDLAYKIKKPVNLGYLDYSTLEQRHAFCIKELELNRRLCPEVYLDVVPLRRSGARVTVGGEGETVEYAVKMKQLPGDRLMDVLLPAGSVSDHMVIRLARKIADFHRQADTGEYIDSFGEVCAITVNTNENFDQTEENIGNTITERQFKRIRHFTDYFLKSHAALMHRRIDEHRIRDCHGDLHCAHVCFSNGICVFDCIEFNDRFRYADVASEVAFLAMDLDRFEKPDLSAVFVDAYVDASQDLSLRTMLPFYKCYRAYVRGKVEGLKLKDPYLGEPAKRLAAERAQRYFELSCSYASPPPTLVIMFGLTGTGKSTVASQISETLGFQVVSSDATRKKLAGVKPTANKVASFQSGIYSAQMTRKTYDELLEAAGGRLSEGESVIIDASFLDPAERARAKALASDHQARFLAVECTAPESVTKARLDERHSFESVSDGRWQTYCDQKARFARPADIPSSELVTIDTSEKWNEILDRIVEKTE